MAKTPVWELQEAQRGEDPESVGGAHSLKPHTVPYPQTDLPKALTSGGAGRPQGWKQVSRKLNRAAK